MAPKYAEKIIVALDTSSLETAEKLLGELRGLVSFYKVGFEFFSAHGWKAVDLVRRCGGRVFLDLKLHDIPNTVSKTVAVLCRHPIDMLTLHTLGGFEMMKRAREIVETSWKYGLFKPLLLGVTVLTSHTESQLKEELGIDQGLEEEVISLATLAHNAGLDGVVSSPHETALLRQKLPPKFTLVTPGIRPEGTEAGDQKRIFTPKEAIEAGADFLVVGRPVSEANNPAKAIQDMLSFAIS